MANRLNGVRIGDRPLHVAVGAGHRNATGGNPAEAALTGRVCQAVVGLAREIRGIEVRCYTPDDGLGIHSGPVDAGPREVAHEWDPVWTVDIFHEVHAQAAPGRPSERGVFVVYPDDAATDDLDQDVRKQGPVLAAILASATGLPVGGPAGLGILSERRTLVGAQGRRLRVFAATDTPALRAHGCRLITEVGCLTNPEDRAIMEAPDFPRRQAAGLLRAYAALAAAAMGWTHAHSVAGDSG